MCLWQEDLKLFISGDQVLPRISSNVSVFPTEPEADPLRLYLESLARLADIPADQPLVVMCHHGMRSMQVAVFLERNGFDTIYNLIGGIEYDYVRVNADGATVVPGTATLSGTGLDVQSVTLRLDFKFGH